MGKKENLNEALRDYIDRAREELAELSQEESIWVIEDYQNRDVIIARMLEEIAGGKLMQWGTDALLEILERIKGYTPAQYRQFWEPMEETTIDYLLWECMNGHKWWTENPGQAPPEQKDRWCPICKERCGVPFPKYSTTYGRDK